MHARPVIGLTGPFTQEAAQPLHSVGDSYVRAVCRAGGLPLHLPCVADAETAEGFLSCLDGLVLTGGDDVDPIHFDEEPLPGLGSITPRRDALELALTRAAWSAGIPILAICRGIQVLNVALGGGVVQDLDSQWDDPLLHRQRAPRDHPSHSVQLMPGTRLHRIYGRTRIRVNSFHHQALGRLAPALQATGWAPDGVVEAVEARDPTGTEMFSNGDSAGGPARPVVPPPAAGQFVLGVQWHPEAMIDVDPGALGLFQALVDAAAAEAAD